MGFWDWTKQFFSLGQDTIYVDQSALQQSTKLNIEKFGIIMAINFIASTISKCEFKTFLNGKEIKGDEYYLWNIEPNVNESSSQFLQKLISRLLFFGEVLVIDINGQLLVADSFNQVEYAVVENYFTDVVVKTMSFNKSFKMSEVMYFKLNDTNIRQLLVNLINGYEELNDMAMGKYKRSGGRKGIVKLNKPATGNEEFQKKVDDLFNKQFKTYFEAENAVIHLYNGMEYDEQGGESVKKSVSEINDIQSITKEAFDRISQAFRMPPALLRGDIADIGKITDNYLTFCIDPIVMIIGEEATRKRYGKQAFIKGSYLKVDTTCIKHIDIFSISEAFDKLIASAGYSVDELRIKVGDTPLNTPWSRKHWITKNYQDVNTVEGGETVE
ncbi:phage portal protein [Clostridium thailandense]|uniref:phage portal protein n=1 Tax=Clostridium thailandense TaxID=2794346 RepID=UPI0039893979